MKSITKYEAIDGKLFDSPDACIAYETAQMPEHKLSGLTVRDIERALTRDNVALADLFEAVGARIAKLRRESGELRRKPNGGAAQGEGA